MPAQQEYPNFLDPKYLAPFKGVDMFITHGTEDRNVLFARTEKVVELLHGAGARVEFVIQPGVGHQLPSPETISRMVTWLKGIADR